MKHPESFLKPRKQWLKAVRELVANPNPNTLEAMDEAWARCPAHGGQPFRCHPRMQRRCVTCAFRDQEHNYDCCSFEDMERNKVAEFHVLAIQYVAQLKR